ncbi:MOSC domain-containing protein [Zavarzinia sp. CC-PAN008]|uniref:MOSC domain-containing protein n=1 Tax=Zavarzinia sp. CC-PAN008 TaxID=3243332 RepID=UPI003F7469BA
MTRLGSVAAIWRFPVKSMAGEQMDSAFVSFSGLLGDRLYAIQHSAAMPGFPYLTARRRPDMLHWQPVFRTPERALAPENLKAAETLGPGLTPLYPGAEALALDVAAPDGTRMAIDDPAVLALLGDDMKAGETLALVRSDRALTDCAPVSIISSQTIDQLGRELGRPMDARRFRMNFTIALDEGEGYGEDALIGRTIRIGARVRIAVQGRDARCKMITYDPETLESDPQVLAVVSDNHESCAGLYCAVLAEGMVQAGDAVVLDG